jgi:hypothetical protein
MKWALALFAVAVLALAAIAKESESPTKSTPRLVLLTLYSPHGPSMFELPGRKSWGGRLWVDHEKIGLIEPGRFLTLKLPEGSHFLAGERFSFFAKENSIHTDISLHRGERYFMRLVIESKAVAGLGPTRWIAERVTCQEAYREAAALEPVKLKRVEGQSLEYIARESYFPECGQ